jgi:small-conductance mechanosensitive channel
MVSWRDVGIAAGVIVATLVVAELVDRRMARRQLAPEVATRYRVLRRGVVATIVVTGVLSALLAIPDIRAVAGAILASGAVIAFVVGLAAQPVLSNFVAGVLIAFTQPLRLGDRVEVAGSEGVVEEIALTYTYIRLEDGSRVVIPNSKLASDTIRNSTIVSREKIAEVTVSVPLSHELGSVVDLLQAETSGERDAEVYVSALDDRATVVVRARADDEEAAERLARELRLRLHDRLVAAGLYA